MVAEKYCGGCSQMRPVTDFCRDRSAKDGLQCWCRKCENAHARDKYPEVNRKSVDTWEKKNPDKVLATIHRRRARKLNAFVEDVSIDRLYELANGVCQICKEPCTREDASIDHIIPLSKGGEHSYKNTQLAHLKCNCKKGNR
jgi:5-methylcytosine-specific restriction endonuclease McrA